MPKVPHSKRVKSDKKSYSKDKLEGSMLRRKARLERTIQRAQQELAVINDSDEADDEEEDFSFSNSYEKRMVIKFFWNTLGRPRSERTWAGRDGVVSYIRQRMGSTAPNPKAVVSTLKRLVDNPEDDLRRQATSQRKRTLSEEEDLYIGLLICEGHSQRSATFLINGERIANGLEPISRHVIRDAEERVELIRRARRKEKSGSSDLSSAWSMASLAFAKEIQQRLLRGAALELLPAFGPELLLNGKRIRCAPTDEWELLGSTVIIPGNFFVGMPLTKEQKKIKYPWMQPSEAPGDNGWVHGSLPCVLP